MYLEVFNNQAMESLGYQLTFREWKKSNSFLFKGKAKLQINTKHQNPKAAKMLKILTPLSGQLDA